MAACSEKRARAREQHEKTDAESHSRCPKYSRAGSVAAIRRAQCVLFKTALQFQDRQPADTRARLKLSRAECHAGADTTTAALSAIQDIGKSNLVTLGYTITYAVGNILLTLWGTVIVAIFASKTSI